MPERRPVGDDDGVLQLGDLRADCAHCVALCCVVPAFTKSADFAMDKPAGTPCPHLADDYQCTIHDQLRPAGFPGCAAFDCFGAGQRLVRDTLAGGDWRGDPELLEPMAAAFPVLRGLHELLWHLRTAAEWPRAHVVRARLLEAADEVEAAGSLPADALAAMDTEALRARVSPLLHEASAAVREGMGGPDHTGADLVALDVRGHDLRGGSFRGALLLGADLRDADLSYADLLGADLRGADLRGTRLADALFVTRMQLGGSRGNDATTVPDSLEHPLHWR
jgi:hypothetical protein